MKRVLYLSSWSLFEGEKVSIPFIYEQIGALSGEVRATYLECSFTSVINWVTLFFTGTWIEKIKSNPWQRETIHVDHFRISLPKFPTTITKNPLWKDFYWGGNLIAKSLRRRIGKIDLIHLHVVLPLGGFGVALSKRLNIPLILQEHSGPFEMHCQSEDQIKGVKLVLNSCIKVLPVSKALMLRMKKYCSQHVLFEIVPNLVHTDIFKPCKGARSVSNTDHVKIITVCSTQKIKRHDLMFGTIKELVNRGVDVHFTMCGVDETDATIVDLIEKMGLRQRISLKGRVSKEILYSEFCQHDIYLCTSDFETFGLAPAEAIACGLPVVSSDCKGVDEFLRNEYGVIVAKQDPFLFADAVVQLMKNNVIDHNDSWKFIDGRYGKDSFVKHFVKIYNDLN